MKIIYYENDSNMIIKSYKIDKIYQIHYIEIIDKFQKKRTKIIIYDDYYYIDNIMTLDRYEIKEFLKNSNINQILDFYKDKSNHSLNLNIIELDINKIKNRHGGIYDKISIYQSKMGPNRRAGD